jgi:DNA (cytosine-5)-methyltransferase 1
MKKKLQVLDLFAGAGGLSHGFEQTNEFKVKIAVEINPNARLTYKHNHPEAKLIKDITQIEYKNSDGTLFEDFNDIDVIIGGPPCQGFSNANRQKNTLISSNNQLVKEYIRAIEDIRPKAFVMENVKSIVSDKHKFFLSKDYESELKDLNIDPVNEQIKIGSFKKISEDFIDFLWNAYKEEIGLDRNMIDKNKIGLTRYLIDIEVLSKFNTLLRWAKKNLSVLNFFNNEKNKRYFEKLLSNWDKIHNEYWDNSYEQNWNLLGITLTNILKNDECNNFHEFSMLLEEIIEVQKVINKISEIIYYKINLEEIKVDNNNVEVHIKSFNVFKYIRAKLSSLGYVLNGENNQIFNAASFGVPQERRRLILIGVLKDELVGESVKIPVTLFDKKEDYYKIRDAIADLEQLKPTTNVSEDEISRTNPITGNGLIQYLINNSNIVYNHVRTESREMAQKRFKALTAGQNFHNLDDSLKATYTDHSRTQNTIYRRLDYNQPSETVVNVRKSMWIHPKLDRAISIREAARLQSFQDSYKFLGTKDSQYQQVGNAVPPLLARFVAESLLQSLGIDLKEKIKDILKPQEVYQ